MTLTGEELRARLRERVEDHERSAAWYRKEATAKVARGRKAAAADK